MSRLFLFRNIDVRVLECLCRLLLILSDDAEINPRPLSNCKEYFSICHWNFNRIYGYDYSKLFFWKHVLYFISLILFVYQKYILILLLPLMKTNSGYILICFDHPSNTKRGGACVYMYRSSLKLLVIGYSLLVI